MIIQQNILSVSETRIINNKIRRNRELRKNIALLVLVFLLAISMIFIIASSKSVASNETSYFKSYKIVCVNVGDSLYTLYDQYEDGQRCTRNDFIDEVLYINNISDPTTLKIGSNIAIPYYCEYDG